MNYRQAVEEIENIPQIGKEPGIVRAARLLEAMGNPQESLKIIHVAGTNGKGSVSMYLTDILMELGYRVGTFVSPHLVTINERIRINRVPVEDDLFLWGYKQAWGRIENPGYFDLLLGMAMAIFAREQVDYVVMETGLGGRLDATNAVERPVLTVITSISLDHCSLLGDTISEIAAEKAAIIKPGVPVVWDAGNEESNRVIAGHVHDKGCDGVPVEKAQWEIVNVTGKKIDFLVNNRYYKNEMFTLNTYARFQLDNAVLAMTAINTLMNVPDDVVRRVLENFAWEGRMERISDRLYIDGAHNIGGVAAFLDSVAHMPRAGRQVLLFSVVKDKQYERMIEMIGQSQLFDEFVVTQLEGSRKLEAEVISSLFEKYTNRPVWIEVNPQKALARAMKLAHDGVCYAAGSLYLAGLIEEMPGGMEDL